MFSFLDVKTPSAKLAEWSPSDWPESLPEMRMIDNLLRCSICYEYFDVAMIVPDCSHNYCSLCIRRSLSYEAQCPTCSLKVNPPSLRSNRVLDELVKNFIKVRAKLLELVTSATQMSSSNSADKKEDEIKNKGSKFSISSTKRRKLAHSRHKKNDSKSSGPDTKRQKLDTENAAALSPVEVTANDQVEDPSMVTEECRSETQESSQLPDADFAECPVCGDIIPHRRINSHLDTCLTRTEKKSSLRRKKSREPKTSKSGKRKCTTEVEDSPAGSSDDSMSCTVIQEACSSTASSSTLTVKGSNALIQTVQKRKPLLNLCTASWQKRSYDKGSRSGIYQLKEINQHLLKEHQDFVMLYNSQCDSPTPMTAAQIVREVEKAEKTRAKEASSTTEASTSGLHFEKDQSVEEMDKTRHKYLNEHQQEFNKLIANIQQRQRGKRNKSATTTVASESLDIKKTDPTEEDLTKSEHDDSDGVVQHNDDQEDKDESMDQSTADVQTYPPYYKDNDQGSSKHDESKTSSLIPEPPSASPSLASLEDEEFTPSLGLGDDDWEFKDDESGDPNVIPESPVIKVGSATDGSEDKEPVLSESGDEF
ncbi:E3 ubiquitin-protein ligase rad18 [Desmophyllum pertusum]|uniref:RING-type E3 ubiquitin transferase n=1 Tax=Desmophyllum pertusum TaxID=174260 RepID=A0A9W9Z9A5_9CNID|nr:E3 ubiquitin-protein ligase rad18 [Desmophyllum pertusum]